MVRGRGFWPQFAGTYKVRVKWGRGGNFTPSFEIHPYVLGESAEDSDPASSVQIGNQNFDIHHLFPAVMQGELTLLAYVVCAVDETG